ncbi:MAG: class I adenylate-forming enzyme family protein [Anaerolineae bacterium]
MILCSQAEIAEYTGKGWWGAETVLDWFEKDVRNAPDAVALVDAPNRAEFTVGGPQRLTFAQAAEQADRLAAGLLEAGLVKDDILMVMLPNIVELPIVYLAAARIGLIVNPLAVQYRTHELRQTIGQTEAKALITTTNLSGFNLLDMARGLQPEFASLKTLVALGDSLPEGVLSLTDLLTKPRDLQPLRDYLARTTVTANDIFTICWTSGTEAEPKGVPRSHNHWIWIAYASIDGCELEPGCNLLNPFPLVNMAGIGGMLIPWLILGGKLVMHQPFSLPVFLGQIPAEKINYTVTPPALLNMLLMQPAILEKTDLSTIKNIGSGSAPLSPWMVTQYQEKYNKYVINIFGSNEGASFTSGPKELPDPVERAQYFPRFGVPEYKWASRVAAQMSTKLVDPATKQVITRPRVPGEMAIKGPGIFSGYYKRPDLTAKAFDQDGYFYTGDLFEIGGQGTNLNTYRFVGRVKDVIIRGGNNISSEEIEGLVQGHPKVAEVAVVGYPDERMGEKVCVVVAPKKDQTVTLEEIVDYLKTKDIAVYKLPEKLVLTQTLPRNPVGKILKRLLRDEMERKREGIT